MVKSLARYFSYVFHGVLALFLIAAAGLALATDPKSLNFEMLPWTGSVLTYTVLCSALFGLLAIVLSFLGKLRWLFFVWAVAVAVMMIKGYIFSGYYFGDGLVRAICLMAGSWIALLGAWFQLRAPRGSWEKRY